MSTARDIPALRIELAVSKRFVWLLSATHLGALAIGAMLVVSAPWVLPLCLLVIASWIRAIARHALLASPCSFIALEVTGERSCALQRRTGEWIHGEIRRSTYVLPWLIVLHLAVEDHTFGTRVCLFSDSMSSASHRRLRMRLRWARRAVREVDSEAPPL